jgi:hypothetical protein
MLASFLSLQAVESQLMSRLGRGPSAGQQMIRPRPAGGHGVMGAHSSRVGVLLEAADEASQPGSPDTDRVGPRLGTHRDRQPSHA